MLGCFFLILHRRPVLCLYGSFSDDCAVWKILRLRPGDKNEHLGGLYDSLVISRMILSQNLPYMQIIGNSQTFVILSYGGDTGAGGSEYC